MPEKINWLLNVQVTEGPKISESKEVQVEAYDKIDVTVPAKAAGPGTATVDVQPGGAGQVKFLLITSSIYDDTLTYTVDGGAANQLDAPLLLIGAGAVKLLGNTQKQFVFSNAIDPAKAASIKILAGRDATP